MPALPVYLSVCGAKYHDVYIELSAVLGLLDHVVCCGQQRGLVFLLQGLLIRFMQRLGSLYRTISKVCLQLEPAGDKNATPVFQV